MAEENKVKIFTDVSDARTIERIIPLLLALLILGAIATGVLEYIESFKLGTHAGFWGRLVDYFLENIWPFWKLFAVILSGLALWGIIYSTLKVNALSVAEKLIYEPFAAGAVFNKAELPIEPKKNKWQKIIEYVNSNNSSDWQLAIIEADAMLDEVLREKGYMGESLGEILKSLTKDELLTLEDAWEAHKMRNTIAHPPADFQLNERETRRIITLFENVFKELGAI